MVAVEEHRVGKLEPRQRVVAGLADRRPELELIVETSHAALPELELPDAVIIDGDHNYFTVHEELRLIDEKAGDGLIPLVLLHDIGWPLARRDSYHDPDRLPADHRQPYADQGFLVPGEAGLAERGLYYERIAIAEGGPRNGVLTAVEDFVAEREHLRLAIVPPFFGLGVLWDERAALGRAPGRDASRRGTATRCSSGWRPSASFTWSPSSRTSSASTRCAPPTTCTATG